MIFNKGKKNLLYFYDNKVDVLRYVWQEESFVIESKKTIDTANEEQNIEFANENLKSVNVFIPDEENYLKLLSFKTTQKISKPEIAKEIESFIPEKVELENIYWERVGGDENENVISVKIIKDEYIKQVLDYLKKFGVKIDNLIFESDLIAKNRVDSEIPEIVLLSKNEKVLIVVTYKGKVWQSITAEKGKENEKIDQIKIDFENKWKIKLTKIVEEKSDVFNMVQFQTNKKNNILTSANFWYGILIAVSIIILAIFIFLILGRKK